MSKTIIPEKLYVTVQFRGDTNNQDGLLGFASPYTQDTAFEKRKMTQDHWAYGSGLNIDIQTDDSVTVTGSSPTNGKYCDAGILFATNCFPRIVVNEPLVGYQLARSVRRHGWSGKGNVVWRISDPRGFDLEITSENFASLLGCVTMEQGVIQGRCIWGRMGPRNVLLPEDSEPYQQALRLTQKVRTQISLRDVQRGDLVEIVSNQVPEEHQRCYYLGKVVLVRTEREYTEAGDFTGVIQLAGAQQEKYVVRSALDGSYHVLNSVKVSEILEACAEPLTARAVAAECNSRLQSCDHNEFDHAHVVLPGKAARGEMQYLLTEHEPVSIPTWPSYDRYYRETFLVRQGQELYIASGRTHGQQHEILLTPVIWNSDQGELTLVLEAQTQNFWYGSSRRHMVVKSQAHTDLTGFDFYKISVVNPDQEVQPVKYLGYF